MHVAKDNLDITPHTLSLLFFKYIYVFHCFMCLSVLLYICMCTTCVPVARGGQKEVSNSLKLEL